MEVKRERAEKMRISDQEAGLTLEEHQAEMQLRSGLGQADGIPRAKTAWYRGASYGAHMCRDSDPNINSAMSPEGVTVGDCQLYPIAGSS